MLAFVLFSFTTVRILQRWLSYKQSKQLSGPQIRGSVVDRAVLIGFEEGEREIDNESRKSEFDGPWQLRSKNL